MAVGIGAKINGKDGEVFCSPSGKLVTDLSTNTDFLAFCGSHNQLPMCSGTTGVSSPVAALDPAVDPDTKIGQIVEKFSDCSTGKITIKMEGYAKIGFVCMPADYVCPGENLSPNTGTYEICDQNGKYGTIDQTPV